MMLVKYSVSTEAVDIKLPLWRQERINKLHRPIDKQRSALAYQLLREALLMGWGIEDEGPWAFYPHGKPYLLRYPKLHFNISHCEEAAACVVANHPVGIDVESIGTQLDSELMEHVCHEEECRSILQAENPAQAFAQIWTRKESYLKYSGTGLVDDLKNLFYPLPPCVWQSSIMAEHNFAMSVCAPATSSICDACS